MKFGKVTLAAAALAAASAPIAGQAVAADRAVAPVEGSSELGGGVAGIAVIFLVIAAVAFALGSDDEPASP